ncbi:MAG: phosphoenolpyruvate carboxykinase [Candidatus Atribacteria bacterium]|nr:phosphoenolpyruvate carboxykinase [Candidatus Atribacteria bacterium]
MRNKEVIIHTEGEICGNIQELTNSPIFERMVNVFMDHLKKYNSLLSDSLFPSEVEYSYRSKIITLLRILTTSSLEEVVKILPDYEFFLNKKDLLHEFVEKLYNFWRKYERYMICHSESGTDSHDQKPYRTFNITVERLSHLVRAGYRDICENITGTHPRVYRQIDAGCQAGIIAVPKPWNVPSQNYSQLISIPFIRQLMIQPPLIFDPPMNKRTGHFQRISQNLLSNITLDEKKWLCYPALVGKLVIFVYFEECFMGLGCSLANLFELADDDQIRQRPDAIYLFGIDPKTFPPEIGSETVFFDDEPNGILISFVPGDDKYGYFGYLKKMVLTLHNIVMMKKGFMPFHGAAFHITNLDKSTSTIVIIGDTATGKSETLEALRILGNGHIADIKIIADDMGSFEIDYDNNQTRCYGTEIGAFVRLDDLEKGYAFEQIDRAIIMSPQKTNARIVLPVTTVDCTLKGYPVDYIFYANNYEEIDEFHPIIERFPAVEKALDVFREGKAMSKGTTTSVGIVNSYFANIFGPLQYHDLHEDIAHRFFSHFFKTGTFIGQIRTRLGIPGQEMNGPQAAASSLIELVGLK